jgi:hypothetical protein
MALALYPHAWRTRYGAEMEALLDAREPSLSALVDVVRGALDAHLRPADLVASPRQQMRGTLWATLTCFAAFGLLGAGFAKATEDVPFRAAGASHPLLADARGAVVVLAAACLGVIAFTGAPLAYGVLRQARRERTPRLVRAIWSATIAVAVLVAAGGVLTVVGRHHRGPWPTGHWLLVAFAVLLALAALTCALAARVALMTTRFSPPQLVLGVGGAWLLARLMVALTAAVALYAATLAVDAPSLAAGPNGPFAFRTTLVFASQLVGMAAASTLAIVTTRRGRAALTSH